MQAPGDFASELSRDGRAVSVRFASSEDREKLSRMLSRLSPRTIYERFHAPYPRVPGWALAGMLEVDPHDRESLVAVAGDEIVGHAMYVRTGNDGEAEFAVLVEDGWQAKGVGRLLLSAERGSQHRRLTMELQISTSGGAKVTLEDSVIEAFAGRLRGELLRPDSAGYEEARRV